MGRVEALQSQLDSFRLEAQAETSAAGNELGEVRANNERLGEELAAATERAEQLESHLGPPSFLDTPKRR